MGDMIMSDKSQSGIKYDKVFAERLRFLRKQRNLSQEMLAKSIGITQPTLCNYEKAQSFPGPTKLIAICNQLETTVDYLLGQTDNPVPPDENKIAMLKKYELLSEDERNWVNGCIELFCNKKR